MNITDILMTFRSTQDITVLGSSADNINSEELNVVVIEILSWLKLEYKRELWQAEGRKTKLKPMTLNMQYPWCNLLKSLLNSKTVFSNVFFLAGNELRFKDDIDEKYRSDTRKKAYEQYNPEKII